MMRQEADTRMEHRGVRLRPGAAGVFLWGKEKGSGTSRLLPGEVIFEFECEGGREA